MNYDDKYYLLLGMGISNQRVKNYFEQKNINYDTFDDKDNDLSSLLDLKKYDYIIKSPSVTLEHHIIKIARKEKIPVISDLELFYLFKPKQKYISITGSNGKTTVTYYLHQLLNKNNIKNIIAGNIGIPLFSIINEIEDDVLIIIETSSYMLESIANFKPLIHVITNIYPHHLEHHKSFKNYFYAKMNPLHENSNTICVYPKNNSLINNELCKRQITGFNFSSSSSESDFWLNNNILHLKKDNYYLENLSKYTKIERLNLLITFSILSILKNIYDDKISIELSLNFISKLKKYPFREEIVYKNEKNLIINDSKSTNYYATVEATKSLYNRKEYDEFYKILILGGKKQKYNLHSFKFTKYYNEVIVYGENRNDLFMLINHYLNPKMVVNLPEVVNYLCEIRKKISNQTRLLILFSPMSASYDQYQSYIERGEHFNSLIKSIYDLL